MPSWGGAAAGAGAGAAIGSVVPVLGTGIGAGVGGLLGGLFGGGSKPKPAGSGSTVDAAPNAGGGYDAIAGQIGQHADRNTKRAGDLSTEGDDALAMVTDYFKKLTGGDYNAVAQATMPQRARVIDQYDTARDAIAKFSPHGGGTTSASAMSRVSEANEISDITAGAQGGAADKLASIGLSQAGLGLNAEQLAGADLNTLISGILGQQQLAVQKSGQKSQATAGIAQAVGQMLALYLTRNKGNA